MPEPPARPPEGPTSPERGEAPTDGKPEEAGAKDTPPGGKAEDAPAGVEAKAEDAARVEAPPTKPRGSPPSTTYEAFAAGSWWPACGRPPPRQSP
jgi:hypothetical protein